MNIRIVHDGVVIDEETRTSLELRLGLVLGRFSTRIARVTAIILDVDGHPEGVGKKCRIEVLLRPTRKIVVEDADTDLDAAIDRASAQIARSVERKLRRERQFDRETAGFRRP